MVVQQLKGSLNSLLTAVAPHPPSQNIAIELQLESPQNNVYADGQAVKGSITLLTTLGKLPDVQNLYALTLELVGHLNIDSYRNAVDTNFCYAQKSLPCSVGAPIPFVFKSPELTYSSYSGSRASITYTLKCTLMKENTVAAYREQTINVINQSPPPPTKPLHIDVGIDDCLHIDLRLDSDSVDLNGQILGNVVFTVVRLAIKHMELNLIRTETIGGPVIDAATDAATSHESRGDGNLHQDPQIVFRYELMDGTPGKLETIPVRVYLRNVEVGPTMVNVANNLSVRYYISVVIIDENDRRYFKKQEITFYRSENKKDPAVLAFESPVGCEPAAV